MLTPDMEALISASRESGWVLEPMAKQLFAMGGIPVPRFSWAKSFEQAAEQAASIGYPLVAKLVSPRALHKSDVGGVVVGVPDADALKQIYDRFERFDQFEGILVEELVGGTELIVGAKIDFQFGPVILMGIGGTAVEIYGDAALRMAPLKEHDVGSMINALTARELLTGHRGSDPINIEQLTSLLLSFSDLVMTLEDRITSIDLNPVMCNSETCVVADARIILTPKTV